MDIPPEIANPPAVVWNEQSEEELRIRRRKEQRIERTISEITKRWDDEYYDHLLKNKEALLNPIIGEFILKDPNNSVQTLQGKQIHHISRHLSHLDYLIQLSNLDELGFPKPAIFARSNIGGYIFNIVLKALIREDIRTIADKEKSFMGCRTIEVPRDEKVKRNLVSQILALTEKGYDLFNYAGKTRNRREDIEKMDSAAFRISFDTAKSKRIDVYAPPHYISYDHTIESKFFPVIDFFKKIHPHPCLLSS